MARLRPIQMSFTNGEVSPRLYGRSDLAKYWNSLETLENFVILPYGGVTRRDGLHYVCPQGDETRKVRLIPFVFMTEQAYVLEFGHEYIRFFMNHGLILETADSDCVLLIHGNGADGSQTFEDSSSSAHTVSVTGTVQKNTISPKFGSASIYFPYDAPSYLYVSDHDDFDFSSNIFTVEFWVKVQYWALETMFEQRTDANNMISVWMDGSGAVHLGVENAGSWQLLVSDNAALTPNVWNHIRIVGDETNYYIFVNGGVEASSIITSSMQNFTQALLFGINNDSLHQFTGWMDEIAIFNTAKSTSAFVPPSKEYPIDTDPYEVVSPYTEADLPGLKWFGSFDTLYLFHPSHAWRKLTRSGHAAWSLDVVDFTNGPWLEEQTDVVFTPTGTTGNIEIDSDIDFFADGHVGALLRLKINDAWGYVKITAVDDAKNADATVVETLDAAAASSAYQEGAWSAYRGHPSCGCFNEESLIVCATDHQPRTVWASVKGDYENFEAGAEDDDAFIYAIPASNRILWPGHLQEMILATGDGIYAMTGGSDDYISPTNVRVRPRYMVGATDLQPVEIANSILYWQKGGHKLLELTYDPNSYYFNTLVAPDLTLLADHITSGGIRYFAWQKEPNSLLWSIRNDGVMLSLTYMRPEEVVGWARQITDGVVESPASIPDPTDTYNEIWVSVMRTINGSTRRYIEYMDPDLMVDSGLTYSGAEISSLSGLDHLEGETVAIVADGVEYDTQIVSVGQISISPAASVVQVGLPYTSKLVTMKPVINTEKGTSAGLVKNWAEIYVSVYETSGLTINDEVIDFRPEGLALGEEIPLKTDDIKVEQLGWGDGRITVEHDSPLPCTILGIFGELEIGD